MDRTDLKNDTPEAQRRSWDVHDRKRQLMALQQRYRKADDYNRPAVRLLIQSVVGKPEVKHEQR